MLQIVGCLARTPVGSSGVPKAPSVVIEVQGLTFDPVRTWFLSPVGVFEHGPLFGKMGTKGKPTLKQTTPFGPASWFRRIVVRQGPGLDKQGACPPPNVGGVV